MPSIQPLEGGSLRPVPALQWLAAFPPSPRAGPADIENPQNADEIATLAQALLRVLVWGDDQPLPPLKRKKSA